MKLPCQPAAALRRRVQPDGNWLTVWGLDGEVGVLGGRVCLYLPLLAPFSLLSLKHVCTFGASRTLGNTSVRVSAWRWGVGHTWQGCRCSCGRRSPDARWRRPCPGSSCRTPGWGGSWMQPGTSSPRSRSRSRAPRVGWGARRARVRASPTRRPSNTRGLRMGKGPCLAVTSCPGGWGRALPAVPQGGGLVCSGEEPSHGR